MAVKPTTEASVDGPPRQRTRWWFLALIAVVVLVPSSIAVYLVNRGPAAEPLYVPFAVSADGTGIDLGALSEAGGDPGWANDVNAGGAVVGSIGAADGAMHAFLSRNGTMIDLGASATAVALNDAGQVLGTKMESTRDGWRPFLWTDGAAQELTSDMGPLWSAADVDEQGRVVGEVMAAPHQYAWPIKDTNGRTGPIGVLWEGGRVTLLETADAMLTRAVRINETGQVLGTGRVSGSWPNHILLWQAGSITDLGLGGPIDMNDRGQIVLQKQDTSGGPFLYCLWDAGRFTPLDGEDGTNMQAYDINGSGVVAGAIDGRGGTQRAAVWRDGHITLLQLDTRSSCAGAINEAGVVVGARQG